MDLRESLLGSAGVQEMGLGESDPYRNISGHTLLKTAQLNIVPMRREDWKEGKEGKEERGAGRDAGPSEGREKGAVLASSLGASNQDATCFDMRASMRLLVDRNRSTAGKSQGQGGVDQGSLKDLTSLGASGLFFSGAQKFMSSSAKGESSLGSRGVVKEEVEKEEKVALEEELRNDLVQQSLLASMDGLDLSTLVDSVMATCGPDRLYTHPAARGKAESAVKPEPVFHEEDNLRCDQV